MESFEHALTQLKTAGATIVETEYADEFLENNPENPNRIRCLEGIRDYVKNDPREDYPHRDVENWEWALEMNAGQEAYKRAAEQDECILQEKMSTHFAAGGGLQVITIPLGYLPNGTEVRWGPRKD
ncbi:hypothetical protein B7494_g3019 [Chlorociboria aeruginascens]|nr:hypothetical protein B7494_g3019 [Chlorociboria aeruginascens]